jgi:hypothetical protein
MSLKEQAKEQAKGVVSKVIGGAVALVVGGGLMWFSPLVDRYIKPPKPMANFETLEGEDALTIKFKNLSQNAAEARWDFGDASPLVTVPGNQAEVVHKFKKSGTYTVKLIVKNVADQEDKREGAIAVGIKPKILDLSVRVRQQRGSGPYTAPATVKFTATSDHDVTYEWNFGDGYKPDADTVTRTFDKPGTYTIRVRPLLGQQKGPTKVHELKIETPGTIVPTGASEPTPTTAPPPPRQAATLSVDLFLRTQASELTRPEERLDMVNLSGKAASSDIEKVVRARPGYVIRSARLEETTIKRSNVINVTTVVSEDRKSIRVTGQVNPPGGVYMLQGALMYQEEPEGKKSSTESSGTLTLPGSLTLDLPPGRKLEFEVRQGGVTVFKQGQLPTIPATLSVEGRQFLLSATLTGQRATISAREVPRQFKQPGVN